MQSGARIDGRFVIDCRIGAGGMGTVYRARDEHTNELVAVKIVREPSARFDREADLLARLEHPGIVRHIAHGRTELGEQFLVMQWLEGEDLQRRLARGPLSIDETLVLARAVAAPLVEVHARGIVHRDVKPSNIWLVDSRVDRPVLLDFGIARPLEARALTATGSAVGTPQYMAPEQVQSPRDVDARADIYALGTVVFECVAGRPPFIGDHALAVLAKVLIETAPSLRDSHTGVSDELADLVGSMLAKRREDRPVDARTLLVELERVPATGTPAPTAVRPRI